MSSDSDLDGVSETRQGTVNPRQQDERRSVSRRLLLISAGTGALHSILLPVTALILLQPTTYGSFSVLYLIYAFALSIQLSVISETWTRQQRSGASVSWAGYSSTSFVLAALLLGGIGFISAFIASWHGIEWAFAIAGALGSFRAGSRYFSVATQHIKRVILCDLAGAIAFTAVFVGLLLLNIDAIVVVAFSWFALSLGSVVALPVPVFRRGDGPFHWVSANRRIIWPLLADSLLMDLGAIGTPLMLAPILGSGAFGVYRGISNVALPVRLILDPLRPVIGGAHATRWFRIAPLLLITGVALALGGACELVLAVVVPSLPLRLGTLQALAPFALPASVFVSASFWSQFFYVASRTNARSRTIVFNRLGLTAAALVFPFVGVWSGQLAGAIWGFALASVVSSITWVLVARPRSGAA